MNLEEISKIGSIISSIIVLIGVPVGLFQYIKTKARLKRENEYKAFDETDLAYNLYLKLCFDNPRLDIFDFEDQNPSTLSAEEKKQELIALTILIGLFERAFFVYQSAPTTIVERQWIGWDDYIRKYCIRTNFLHAWQINSNQYDMKFQKYINTIITNYSDINRKNLC
jgi:hypothetical protein